MNQRLASGRVMAGVSALACVLAIGGLATQAGLLPAELLAGALRHGGAAFVLGALWAGPGATHATPWRRLSFPLLSALANVLALRAALWAGAGAERLGQPFAAGPALASTLFAALYALLGWRWLACVASPRLAVLAAGAGAGSFAASLLLREASQGRLGITLHMALFWALWMVLVSGVWTAAGRRAPTA